MRLISVMRMLLYISLIYESTHETYFQIQKGTYSKIQLCKNSSPFYETSARSIIECLSICLILLGNKCKNFKYRWEERNCSIYQDVIRYDYVGFPKKDCIGYQLVTNCPKGFRYLVKGNKCVEMLIGNWNWSMARKACNALNPGCHPVILDLKNDVQLFSLYIQAEILPNCPNPLYPNLYCFWTAGTNSYIFGQRQPFLWNPFPGVTRQLESTTPWNPGEPNSPVDGSTYCMSLIYNAGMDDFYCYALQCVLCEFDLI